MFLTSSVAVFRLGKLLRAEKHRQRLVAASLKPRPQEPVVPPYVPKFHWHTLPSDYLADYPPTVWKQMPENPFPISPQPWIDPEALVAMGEMSLFPDLAEVEAVAEILRLGADTGVKGAARLPQEARNSPRIQELGPRVLDTVRDWLEKVRT